MWLNEMSSKLRDEWALVDHVRFGASLPPGCLTSITHVHLWFWTSSTPLPFLHPNLPTFILPFHEVMISSMGAELGASRGVSLPSLASVLFSVENCLGQSSRCGEGWGTVYRGSMCCACWTLWYHGLWGGLGPWAMPSSQRVSVLVWYV